MMNPRVRTALIVIGLFFATWLPRVLQLDRYVTIDERKWLARSANFYYALAHGDLASTFQREHPGVTVMWAGTLGLLQKLPELPRLAPGYFTWNDENFEAWLKAGAQLTPLELLAAGRWWIVLGVAILIALSYFPLRRLLGSAPAAVALLFVAWAPFTVALSRELHPDGYVSSLIFVALVFFLGWLYGGQRKVDLAVSGIIMGLAWLTKTPAAFLVPTGALLIGAEIWRGRRWQKQPGRNAERQTAGDDPPAGWRGLAIGYVLWGVIATATFVLLWPSMWINPLGTLLKMGTEMEAYVEGHVNGNFFLGQPTNNPGLFFYPVAYLFRVTPAVLIGLVLALVGVWRRWGVLARPRPRRTAFGLAVFAVIFALLMTIPAKKFDRYLLPAFLPLDVVAALGWVVLAQQVGAWWAARRGAKPGSAGRFAAPVLVVLAGLLLLHGLFTALTYPYYLTYFNPLMGGSRTAAQAMFVGWGDGLDEAARWLNAQPNAEQMRTVAWYSDGPLSYFLKGRALPMGYSSALSWLDVDYVVTYANQVQRQLPSPEAVAYFESKQPVHTVTIDGLDLAKIYDMHDVLLPPFIDLNTGGAADFGGQIRLIGADLDKENVAPGGQLQATLYLQGHGPVDKNYNILVQLVGADGHEAWRQEGWPWGAPTKGWPLREVRPDGHRVTVPAAAAPGLYKLTATIYDPATLDRLPMTDPHTGQPIDGNTRDVALLQVGQPAAAANQFPQPWQFDRYFTLSGADLPATAAAGSDLKLALQWDSLTRSQQNYTVFVHVVGPDGQLAAQQDRPPRNGFAPTALWNPGLRIVDDYTIALPANLKPGKYAVQVGLYTPDGRLPVSHGGAPAGDYAVAGQFEVR